MKKFFIIFVLLGLLIPTTIAFGQIAKEKPIIVKENKEIKDPDELLKLAKLESENWVKGSKGTLLKQKNTHILNY